MDTYELKIDFVRDSTNPARVFRSMAGLIDSFERTDRDLLAGLGFPASSQLLLHDVESGSIKSILRWLLKLPDKEALRDGDWKKILGRMIDDSREFFLKKLEETPKIESKDQLIVIQKGFVSIAEQVPHQLIHVVRPIPLPRILTMIQSFESSTRMLIDGDKVEYRVDQRATSITTEISINPELEEELLEAVPTEHPMRTMLPVKKPDLIGDSQWDMYLGSKVIRAKIIDTSWLDRFHSRDVELKPGDALDALLEITLLYSYDGELVGYRYRILEVYGVVPSTKWKQLDLPGHGMEEG